MNRLPTKQIYLLVVIIVGIIALSLYSTYAIFTYQSETSDVVAIELPSALSISTDMYEYKQLEVKPKTTNTTDIDIYNTFDYDLCYSIWYKNISSESNIEVSELNSETLTSSGTITAGEAKRVTLLIINNSSSKEKINIGVATDKKDDICNLKISSDKKTIKTNIDKEIKFLSKFIKDNIQEKKNDFKEGYLIYGDIKESITLNSIIVSEEFTQEKEIFTLKNPVTIEIKDQMDDITNKYLCANEKCNLLYKINSYEIDKDSVIITNYDILVPYEKGDSGIKKVDKDYYFYGDNPNNFVKFNCDESNNCELWRIIGLFQISSDNYSIKLIKNESIAKQSYNTNKTNIWDGQNTLYQYLQKEYKPDKELEKLLDDTSFYQETLDSDNKITKGNDNIKNINLINYSDFLNTSTCKTKNNTDCLKGNWLNNSLITSEWTMTNYIEIPKEDELEEELETEEIIKAVSVGNSIEINNIETKLSIRPTIFISDRTLIFSGDGSFDNPYILK